MDSILFINDCLNNVFLCGTENGIEVFGIPPNHLSTIDVSEVGSVRLCDVLPNSKKIAVVSGGLRPKFPENSQVNLYDGDKKDFLRCFNTSGKVLAVRLRNDRIFIVQQDQVEVFSIDKLAKKIYCVDTLPNPRGLCAINAGPAERRWMILPEETGSVIVYDLDSMNSFRTKPYSTLKAHSSDVVAMSVNNSGTMLATASVKGTLIRVFDVAKGEKLHQLKRGSEYATIFCISFSDDSNYICVSSDRGTVHLFSLNGTQSMFSISTYLNWILPEKDSYFKSFASFPIPPNTRNMCTFGTNNNIYVVTYGGILYEYKFEDGKGCVKEREQNLSSLVNEDKWFDAQSNFHHLQQTTKPGDSPFSHSKIK